MATGGGVSIKMAEGRSAERETTGSGADSTVRRCVFCRIATKDEEADIVYEDESYVCFRDRSPVATHHYLLIPRQHVR